jgi:hypothetical protein
MPSARWRPPYAAVVCIRRSRQKTKNPAPTSSIPTRNVSAAHGRQAANESNGSGQRKVQPAANPPNSTAITTRTAPPTIAR